MAKAKDNTPTTNDEASKNLLGALLNGYKDTHMNFIKTDPVRIPSGSFKLDQVASVKSGMTIRMGGPAEVGKTSQAFLFAANYMKTMPRSKTFYVNAEAKLSSELAERTGLKFTEDDTNWDYGTVFILNSNVFDTICDMLLGILKSMFENKEHLCIIIDSVDMLTLKSSLDKKVGDGRKPAGVNFLTKELFRRLNCIQKYNALLVMITQYSAVFNIDPYAKEAPQLMEDNNTHALNHQCSYAFYYRPRNRKDYILEDEDSPPDVVKNKILGVRAKVEIKKASTGETGYVVEVPIKKGRIGNAIWVEKELVDMLLYFGLLLKNGGWFSFASPVLEEAKQANIELKEKVQGLDKVYEYLEENKQVFDFFYNKIKIVMS